MVPDGIVMLALIVSRIPTTLTGACMRNKSSSPGLTNWVIDAWGLTIFTGWVPSSPEWTVPVSFSAAYSAQFAPVLVGLVAALTEMLTANGSPASFSVSFPLV